LLVFALFPTGEGHDLFIELAAHALIGSKNDRACCAMVIKGFQVTRLIPKQDMESQLNGPAVVGQRFDRSLILTDAHRGKCFHGCHDGTEIPSRINSTS
jgi:hypothetical protein